MVEGATGHAAADAAEPVAVAVLVAEGPVRDRVVDAVADADAADFAISTATRTAEVVELVEDDAVDCVVAGAEPSGAAVVEQLYALCGADPGGPVVLLAGAEEATRGRSTRAPPTCSSPRHTTGPTPPPDGSHSSRPPWGTTSPATGRASTSRC